MFLYSFSTVCVGQFWKQIDNISYWEETLVQMNPGILEKILNETLAYKCIVMHFQYQSLGLRQIIVAALKITSDYYKNPQEWSNFTYHTAVVF